jgi:hypothetical protein
MTGEFFALSKQKGRGLRHALLFRDEIERAVLPAPRHINRVSRRPPKINAVISGRREAASPESITTAWGYGFRARAKRRVPE